MIRLQGEERDLGSYHSAPLLPPTLFNDIYFSVSVNTCPCVTLSIYKRNRVASGGTSWRKRESRFLRLVHDHNYFRLWKEKSCGEDEEERERERERKATVETLKSEIRVESFHGHCTDYDVAEGPVIEDETSQERERDRDEPDEAITREFVRSSSLFFFFSRHFASPIFVVTMIFPPGKNSLSYNRSDTVKGKLTVTRNVKIVWSRTVLGSRRFMSRDDLFSGILFWSWEMKRVEKKIVTFPKVVKYEVKWITWLSICTYDSRWIFNPPPIPSL